MGCVLSTEDYDPVIVCSNVGSDEVIIGSLVLPNDHEYSFHVIENGVSGWCIVACLQSCHYHTKVTNQVYAKRKHAERFCKKIINNLEYIKNHG